MPIEEVSALTRRCPHRYVFIVGWSSGSSVLLGHVKDNLSVGGSLMKSASPLALGLRIVNDLRGSSLLACLLLLLHLLLSCRRGIGVGWASESLGCAMGITIAAGSSGLAFLLLLLFLLAFRGGGASLGRGLGRGDDVFVVLRRRQCGDRRS